MESDLQHQQQKQMNSGLMRYQSAPSSYFAGFLDREFCEDLLNRPSSPETQRIFARFLSNTGGNIKQDPPVREVGITASVNNNNNHGDDDDDDKAQIKFQQQQQQHPMNNYSYQKPPLPDQNSGSGMNYRAVPSMGMERLPPMKTSSGGGGNNLNLVRHSSSPAGLFSNISIEFENEYAVLRGMGDFGAVNKETSYSAATGPLASPGPMSPIAEMGDRIMPENVPDNNGGFSETHGSNYVTGFPVGSWDESSIMPAHAKRLTDEDRSLSGLNASETQSGETGSRPPVLAHHLSLPKTSAEISAIEKFLQFQDSVPCKIRAKRGCATHPRSIAERVRRTRISERMRKLQDLVPNMDKQTNTADMLDLAVDYIKDLQREVKALSENRANCRCTNKRLP